MVVLWIGERLADLVRVYEDRRVINIDPVRMRCTALLTHDYDDYVSLESDPLFGRTVPYRMLRENFETDREWRLFVGRTHKKWLKWVNKSKLCDSDRCFLSNTIYDSLRAEP